MDCSNAKMNLGPAVDGELQMDVRTELDRHLAQCADCRRELDRLQELASAFEPPHDELDPQTLWQRIEQSLDQIDNRRRHAWKRRRPLAAAAAVIMGLMAGWMTWNATSNSSAHALAIDFRPLLQQAEGDIKSGINALIETYGGRPISLHEAGQEMQIRVHAPESLPGALKLESRYMLNMGRRHRSLAFHYQGEAGHLLMLQCPPAIEKHIGAHECMSCQVGLHSGEGLRVGKLYLMHMKSDNVCVCIVTTLDELRALPAALKAVTIDF